MKKMNNKGFSLVELIIVIAIMAILAGAIAPALIRYIDKSRRSNDVTSCKAIKTAVETALGNESIYEYLTNNSGLTTIKVVPGKSTSTAGGNDAIVITGCSIDTTNGMAADIDDKAAKEIGTNIGEKTPKLKYRKAAGTAGEPVEFVGVISKKGTVYVFISAAEAGSMEVESDDTVGCKSDDGYQICPNVCDEYQ